MSEDYRGIGSIFKEARTAKSITLEAVSKATKIHINILKAIEGDDTKTLGVVYVKGFLKLYAEYLGLDKSQILNRFQEGLSPDEAKSAQKIVFPEARPSAARRSFYFKNFKKFVLAIASLFKKLNYKVLIYLFLALFFVAGIKSFVKHQRRKAEIKTGTEIKEVSKGALKKSATRDEKIILVVRAKQRCWLQVKVDGKIVSQSVLAKGTAESWQANGIIELWLGNAGGVELELNGRVLERIGRPGQMLKNVVVARDGLSIKR